MAFVVSRNYEILTNPSEEKDPLKIFDALPVNLIRHQQQPIYRENDEKFPHDEDRENWKSQRDFWMACIGCSFGIPAMFYVPYLAVITTGGASFLVMYAIALFFVCTPVIFLQMTIGQYSRTGFVSFFRFSPLWKGIGYVMLIFNLSKCLLHDYLASLQIFYMVDKQIAANETFDKYTDLIGCSLIVWLCVVGILTYGLKRYALIATTNVSLALIFFGTLFLKFGATSDFVDWFRIIDLDIFKSGEMWFYAIFHAMLTLGCGLGTFSTLGSFNNFKENPLKYAFGIPTVTLILTVITCSIFYGLKMHHLQIYPMFVMSSILENIKMYPFATFWTCMVCGCVFLIQLHQLSFMVLSVMTALSDEVVSLRQYKAQMLWILGLVMYFVSILSRNTITYENLMETYYISHAAFALIIFLEMVAVCWFFDRRIFIKNFLEMTKIQIPHWILILLQIYVPLMLMAWITFMYIYAFVFNLENLNFLVQVLCIPAIVIPIAMIFKIINSEGSCLNKLSYCCKPEQWDAPDNEEPETVII